MKNGTATIKSYQIGAGDLSANILNLGATLQSLHFKEYPHSLVLGSEDVADYEGELRNAGVIIGPVANRISNAQFKVGTQQYQVDANFLGKHCLHSGSVATANQVWDLVEHTANTVVLSIKLAAGKMGFPGPMEATAKYKLTENNQLCIEIIVSADVAVPCSWTEHNYFNFDGSDTLENHDLEIQAAEYLPIDNELIPTGEICSVDGTEFDLRTKRSLRDISLDHNFCISERMSPEMRPVARLGSTMSGILMLVESNEPGLQVYTGQHLASNRSGIRAGVALEPQGWPDALNNANFPSIILASDENYIHKSRYTFTS